MHVSHLIVYLRYKFHDNIPNDCHDIANLLLGYFNLGHPVEQLYDVRNVTTKPNHRWMWRIWENPNGLVGMDVSFVLTFGMGT